MHLFLSGPRGIGKSTLLQKALLPYQDKLSGFMVQRLIGNGIHIGFRASLIRGCLPPIEAEYKSGMEDVFILRGHTDISVLESIIVQAEADSLSSGSRMIVLDEIGGLELASPVFMSSLLRMLSNGKPCIGVLKSQKNLEHTLAELGLDESYLDLRSMLERTVKSCGEILNFNMGCEIERHVCTYVRDCMI